MSACRFWLLRLIWSARPPQPPLSTSMPIFASRACGRRPFSCLHSRYHGLSTSRACSAYVMNSIHRVALSRVLFDARLQQKSMFQYPCWFLYTEIYKFWDILCRAMVYPCDDAVVIAIRHGHPSLKPWLPLLKCPTSHLPDTSDKKNM